MPPPAYKPKKKEPEIQSKFEKPPPMVVQKTLLRRTPTWKLQKHKQYFQNAAAWLVYIFNFLSSQSISARHFSINLFILVPRQHPKHTILQRCWNIICENIVDDLLQNNSELAGRRLKKREADRSDIGRKIDQKDEQRPCFHLQMTHFNQSSTCFLYMTTYPYSSGSLHVDSCILIFKNFLHTFVVPKKYFKIVFHKIQIFFQHRKSK